MRLEDRSKAGDPTQQPKGRAMRTSRVPCTQQQRARWLQELHALRKRKRSVSSCSLNRGKTKEQWQKKPRGLESYGVRKEKTGHKDRKGATTVQSPKLS